MRLQLYLAGKDKSRKANCASQKSSSLHTVCWATIRWFLRYFQLIIMIIGMHSSTCTRCVWPKSCLARQACSERVCIKGTSSLHSCINACMRLYSQQCDLLMKGKSTWVHSGVAYCCAIHGASAQHVHEDVLVSQAISGFGLFGKHDDHPYHLGCCSVATGFGLHLTEVVLRKT